MIESINIILLKSSIIKRYLSRLFFKFNLQKLIGLI